MSMTKLAKTAFPFKAGDLLMEDFGDHNSAEEET